MIGYIYKHTAPNGKSYIGQTYNKNGYKARWRGGAGYEKQTLIRRAIDKYSWASFQHDILYIVEREELSSLVEELNRLEEYEILSRGTIAPNGYNNAFGGQNKSVSDSTRAIQSAIAKKRYLNGYQPWNKGLAKENQPRYGKKQSKNQKEAARIAMKESWKTGRIKPREAGSFKHSEETRKKISESQLDKRTKHLLQ